MADGDWTGDWTGDGDELDPGPDPGPDPGGDSFWAPGPDPNDDSYWRGVDEDSPGCALASLAVLAAVAILWGGTFVLAFLTQWVVQWAGGLLK